MANQHESFRHLDDFLDKFRIERLENKKTGWFTLSSLRKRLYSEAEEYPRLRRSDTEFFREKLVEFRGVIESADIPVDHLKDYSVALRGHLAALNNRSSFLALLAPLSVAIMAVFTAVAAFDSSWPKFAHTVMFACLALLVLVAILERGQILGWAPADHEFLLLLDREIT